MPSCKLLGQLENLPLYAFGILFYLLHESLGAKLPKAFPIRHTRYFGNIAMAVSMAGTGGGMREPQTSAVSILRSPT